jgi:O-antigen/teichoic acid export membrane protein
MFIAILIPIFASPVITRLYSPVEYAVLAAYFLVVTLMAPAAMLRYEVAIIMPRRRSQTATVAALSILCVAAVALAMLAIMLVSPGLVPKLVGEPGLRGWQLLAPLGILLSALVTVFQYLALREGDYRVLAISRIVGASLTSLVAISAGLLGHSSGALILAQVIGGLGGVLFLTPAVRPYLRFLPAAAALRRLGWTANRYRRYPIISLPSDFIGTLGVQGYVLAISVLFGPAALGAMSFGQRIVGTSSSVLGKGIGDVFRREAARQWNETGSFQHFYAATFLWMSLFALIMYVPLLFLGPLVFRIVFGAEWEVAGRYVSLLSPFFAFQFVGGNLSHTIYIVERQDIDVYIQSALLAVVGIATVVGLQLKSIELFLMTMSGLMCLVYAAYIFICWRLSHGKADSIASPA